MEKIRLKARHSRSYLGSEFVHMLSKNYTQVTTNCWKPFARKFPKLARKIKAADGKCITIEITMKAVKK